MTTITETIQLKLTQQLSPQHLEIINESHQHNVPAGSETHFKLVVVSSAFQGLSLIKRHQTIHQLLQAELEMTHGIHALSMHTYTPEEWLVKQHAVLSSPKCKGGFDK